MRSFFLKAVLFVVVFKLIDFSLLWEFRRLASLGPVDDTSLNILYSGRMKEDIVCFGDSRIRYHVHPKVLQEETGLSAYNFGLAATNFDQQFLTLREYLDNERRPSIVIFEADSRQMDPSYLRFDEKVFRPYISYSARVAELFDSSPTERAANWLVRCRAFKGRATSLLRTAFGKAGSTSASTIFKGASVALDGHHPAGLHAARTVQPGSESRKTDYRTLVQLAESEKLILVLLTPPEYRHDVQLDPATADRAYDFFSQLARSSNWVYYLNYARDPRFTNADELWWDAQHLNLKGMNKFSASLGQELNRIKDKKGPKLLVF